MDGRLRSRFAALAGAALVIYGCGASDNEEAARLASPPKPLTALDVEAARAAATAGAPGAQGAGPGFVGDAPAAQQLPADAKIALKGEIEPWLFSWRVSLGTFRVEELAQTGTRPLALDRLEPFDGNAPGEDLRLLHLALPSPGGTTVLDPYLDWSLTARGDQVYAHRDGRATVALIDLKSHVRQHLFDARAPYGRFDGAQWLDADRFVVYAAERFEPNPWRGGPVVYLVDLAAGTATRFQGPAVDYAGFKLVEKDLERQFRKGLPDVIFF
jgi:hypothetical protein